MTHRSQLPAEERHIVSRLHKLISVPGLMRGNLVLMKRKCGKQGCHCEDSKQPHVSLYVAQSSKGKPCMLYVPTQSEQRIRQFTERYRQIRQLLEKLSELYWERLKQRKQ